MNVTGAARSSLSKKARRSTVTEAMRGIPRCDVTGHPSYLNEQVAAPSLSNFSPLFAEFADLVFASHRACRLGRHARCGELRRFVRRGVAAPGPSPRAVRTRPHTGATAYRPQIGRASWRERGGVTTVAAA